MKFCDWKLAQALQIYTANDHLQKPFRRIDLPLDSSSYKLMVLLRFWERSYNI